jgi:geranylgeranyl pyrophosphate synthase
VRASSCTQKALFEAKLHIERALSRLEIMDASPEREALENLARYIIDRKT